MKYGKQIKSRTAPLTFSDRFNRTYNYPDMGLLPMFSDCRQRLWGAGSPLFGFSFSRVSYPLKQVEPESSTKCGNGSARPAVANQRINRVRTTRCSNVARVSLPFRFFTFWPENKYLIKTTTTGHTPVNIVQEDIYNYYLFVRVKKTTMSKIQLLPLDGLERMPNYSPLNDRQNPVLAISQMVRNRQGAIPFNYTI